MDRIIHIPEKDFQEFYDSLCRILTEFEERPVSMFDDICEYAYYFYDFLADLQNKIDGISYD